MEISKYKYILALFATILSLSLVACGTSTVAQDNAIPLLEDTNEGNFLEDEENLLEDEGNLVEDEEILLEDEETLLDDEEENLLDDEVTKLEDHYEIHNLNTQVEDNVLDDIPEDVAPLYIPNQEEMLSICQLAVLEYQYNNVAIYEKKIPVFLFPDKKIHFWIQYTGIVKVGIDVSDVHFQVEKNIVEITLPPMEVLSCKVDESSFTPDSYIYHPDSKEADVDDQRTAISQANSDMLYQVTNDNASMKLARTRVELLLTNYIQSIGEATGVNYEIRWM